MSWRTAEDLFLNAAAFTWFCCFRLLPGSAVFTGFCTKPSHGLPVELACLGVVSLLLEVEHLPAQGGVMDCGLVLLWPVKLALLLETRT